MFTLFSSKTGSEGSFQLVVSPTSDIVDTKSYTGEFLKKIIFPGFIYVNLLAVGTPVGEGELQENVQNDHTFAGSLNKRSLHRHMNSHTCTASSYIMLQSFFFNAHPHVNPNINFKPTPY